MALYSNLAPQLPPLRSLSLYPSAMPLTADGITTSNRQFWSKQRRPLPAIPEPILAPMTQSSTQRPEALLSSSSSKPPPTATPIERVHHNPVPTTRVLSSFMPRVYISSLISTLQIPSILAAFVSHLDWAELHPLFITCKTLREVFRESALRDVVLSRFVPGYSHCLRHRDMNHYQDVQVSMHDLDLLCTSVVHGSSAAARSSNYITHLF